MWSESDLAKIMAPKGVAVSLADLPALWERGARVYGINDGGTEIVRVASAEWVARYGVPDHLWVSDVTVADMTREW